MVKDQSYYVPAQSKWPIIGAFSLGVFALGAASFFQGANYGPYLFGSGVVMIIFMMTGWFRNVINESEAGKYSEQMDKSFRWGMAWFIFSEVMFFAGFFGALFYTRMLSVPWLGGEGHKLATNQILWEGFKAAWPLLKNPDPNIIGPKQDMGAWGLPLINTFLLLSSSVTVTVAHHALRAKNRRVLNIMLFMTVILGASFLGLQAYEYHEAYVEYGLRIDSGIYGTTFFMLTGFHGMHVTIGTIMLAIILMRCLKGHFKPENHFGFEATAWYWHFVDIVWLILFVYVYILPLR